MVSSRRVLSVRSLFVVLGMVCVAATLGVFVGGTSLVTRAEDPTIRQSPLDTISTCPANAHATLTYQGIECKTTADTWRASDCDTPADCCDQGAFLRITPTGLTCTGYNNGSVGSTYDATTFCSDCCGASEFATITTLGLKCVGGTCSTSDNECTNSATPGCNTEIKRCVQCTKNSHCTGTSVFCDTDTNKCTSCTRDTEYVCDKNDNRVQHCRNANGDIVKTYPESCNADQTCSNGQCVCRPVDGTWSTLPAANTIACNTTRTATCTGASCGGTCPGDAPTVTGTKCSTGYSCTNTGCVAQCTHATKPATPTATAGNGRCTISAAESTTGYTYEYCKQIPNGYTCLSNNVFTNLTNDTTYAFKVRRKNDSGSCTNWAWSDSAVNCTPTASCAPTNGGYTATAASTIDCGTTHTETCTNPAPSCGGSACSTPAPTVDGTKCSAEQRCINGSCTTQCTPVNCTWGSYGDWSPDVSTKDCGTSFTQTATRSKTVTESCGGTCTGDNEKTQTATGTQCTGSNVCVSNTCCSHATQPLDPTVSAGDGTCSVSAADSITSGYEYEYRKDSGDWQESGEFSDLDNGKTYYFDIRRKNDSGNCQDWAVSPGFTSCTPGCESDCSCPYSSAYWTPASASDVACGTTETQRCVKGTTSCGAEEDCTGTAQTLTGTYCASGTCENGSCTTPCNNPDWETGSWSSSCSQGKQTRTVECKCDNGNIASNESLCTATKPNTEKCCSGHSGTCGSTNWWCEDSDTRKRCIQNGSCKYWEDETCEDNEQCSGGQCSALAGDDCEAKKVTWDTNCSTTLPKTGHNKSVDVTNTATGYTGTATFTCDDGDFVLSTSTTATCSVAGCTSHSDCSEGGLTTGGSDGEYCSACSGASSSTCSGTGTCKSCTWGDNWCSSDAEHVRRSCKVGTAIKRYGNVKSCSYGCFYQGFCNGCDISTDAGCSSGKKCYSYLFHFVSYCYSCVSHYNHSNTTADLGITCPTADKPFCDVVPYGPSECVECSGSSDCECIYDYDSSDPTKEDACSADKPYCVTNSAGRTSAVFSNTKCIECLYNSDCDWQNGERCFSTGRCG